MRKQIQVRSVEQQTSSDKYEKLKQWLCNCSSSSSSMGSQRLREYMLHALSRESIVHRLFGSGSMVMRTDSRVGLVVVECSVTIRFADSRTEIWGIWICPHDTSFVVYRDGVLSFNGREGSLIVEAP